MSFRFDTVQNALPNNLKKKVFVCVNHRQNHDTVSNVALVFKHAATNGQKKTKEKNSFNIFLLYLNYF